MLALSPDRRDKTALINQDAFFSVCRLEAKHSVNYVLHLEGNGVYIHCAGGSVEIAEQKLQSGDAMGMTETNDIHITALEDAELIFAEIPMQRGIKM